LGFQNPFESQAAGSLSLLIGATAPAFTLFPCGFLLPGLGMDPASTIGELLVDVFPPNPALVLPGPALAAPGDRAEIQLQIPADPSLNGMEVFFQGALLDLSPTAGIRRGLTEGLRLRLHS
jgi:hypothetical protein